MKKYFFAASLALAVTACNQSNSDVTNTSDINTSGTASAPTAQQQPNQVSEATYGEAIQCVGVATAYPFYVKAEKNPGAIEANNKVLSRATFDANSKGLNMGKSSKEIEDDINGRLNSLGNAGPENMYQEITNGVPLCAKLYLK